MKQSVSDLPDQFLTDLKNGGLSYEEMMNKYGLTRWGARKVGDQPVVDAEEVGNHEKVFAVNEDEVPEPFKALKVPVREEEVNYEEERRVGTEAKQTFTNKANKYLTDLEQRAKNVETPETSFSAPEFTDDGFTALIHETDPHFSAEVTNRRGEIIFDTEKAVEATDEAFEWYVNQIGRRKGRVDEIVLLLGGDLVEGEDIYEGQAYEVDQTLENQISSARRCYFKNLKRLAEEFEVPLKVVCVSGNHGDMGTGSGVNADDIIYSQLEDMVDLSELENVKFVKTDRSDFTTFSFRNWSGYLTHGENRSHHIGTSSPQSDWLSIKDEFGFDLAFRGHYHNQKVENVNGAPVVMTNSRKPGDDYTDRIATFGTTGNAIYFATDDEVLDEICLQTGVVDGPR